MDSAAVPTTQEQINLLILCSQTSLGNKFKNRFNQADLKRFKQIQVIQYSEYLNKKSKQRPHAVICLKPDDKEMIESQNIIEGLIKYEIKVKFCTPEEKESMVYKLDNNNDELGFACYSETEFEELRSYLINTFDSLIAKIKQIFEIYDEDKSGSLETMELGMVFKSLKVELSDDELERCAIDIDTDGSGTITFEEFSTWFLTGKEGAPASSGQQMLSSLKDKAQSLSNEFLKELINLPKLEKKDMHIFKFEAGTKKFETKTAASHLNLHFGIASNSQEPILTQRETLGFDGNNKFSHVMLKFKLKDKLTQNGDNTEILQKFNNLKIVSKLYSSYQLLNRQEGNKDGDFNCATDLFENNQIVWGISSKALHAYLTNQLEAAMPTLEKLLRLPKAPTSTLYQQLKLQLSFKKMLEELIQGKNTILQCIMAGFKLKGELHLFRKVDDIINQLIQVDETAPPLVKTISQFILMSLKTQADAHVALSPPQIIEFQNNLLSYVGEEYASLLNVPPKVLVPFAHQLKQSLKRFKDEDLNSFENFKNPLVQQGLITFLALAMIIDPENLPDEDIEAMASGIEEFFAFMMENFEGQVDVTYFFYRVMFIRLGLNIKDLIKMLFCLSQTDFDEEDDHGEGKQEANQDQNNEESQQEEDAEDHDDDDNQYGDYDDEIDYGQENQDDEGESQKDESKQESVKEESQNQDDEKAGEDFQLEEENLHEQQQQEEEKNEQQEDEEQEQYHNFDDIAQNYTIQGRRTAVRGMSVYTNDQPTEYGEEDQV